MRKLFSSKGLRAIALGLTVLGAADVAQAVSVTGTAVGSWSNVTDTTGVSVYHINNNDSGATANFDWGTTYCPTCVPPTTSFNNLFTFDGVGSDGDAPFNALVDVPFLVGEFTYRNGSTINSIGVSAVDLSVAVAVQTPVTESATSTFDFTIVNTPNATGNPVLDGDIVIVANSINPVIFSYANVNYILNVVGFSKDGGLTFTNDFSSPEGQTAGAGLYAMITASDQPVPEPGTITLLGMAVAGLAARKRVSVV